MRQISEDQRARQSAAEVIFTAADMAQTNVDELIRWADEGDDERRRLFDTVVDAAARTPSAERRRTLVRILADGATDGAKIDKDLIILDTVGTTTASALDGTVTLPRGRYLGTERIWGEVTEMPVRCTVLDDYQGVSTASADWAPVSDRVLVRTLREHFADEAQLGQVLQDDEIVVIMRERTPFPESLFDRLPRLRLLVTTGWRNASVDFSAAARHGVTVCGTASGSRPPAELTWALILGLARHLVAESAALRSDGPWQSTIGTDLIGATLGLLGLGRIGGDVARVGLAFGMDVQAWSQNLTPEHAAAQGVRRADSMHDLFASSDFVSIHLVLGDRTRGLVDRATLGSMRPSAYLINTARAAIVDQAALLEALQRRRLAGAGLDVFDLEPLPAGHPFRTLPNVLATPHLGYVTQSNYSTYYTQVVEDIEAFLTGRPIRILSSRS